MCQDFRAAQRPQARLHAVTRPGLELVRRPAPPAGFFAAVRNRLGPEAVLTDPAELIPYEIDAGQDRATPDAVVFPRSAADVVDLVATANRHGVVLVPRAGGTCLSGGPIAVLGGAVIGFSRMNRVHGIDPVARQATVDPCVINLDLQAHLAPHQLFYPPDPASQRASTIGGNISENAGGPHCFKYGTTTSYVQALDLVLPSGETARAGGPAADYPEYDFAGLLTGSEGTLAFITGATVRAVRAPPAAVVMMAVFDSLVAAAASVSAIIARGLVPAALEMMDRPITRAIEEYVHAGLPDAEAILVAEIDGYAASLAEQSSALRAICEEHGASEVRLAFAQAERDRIWFARKSAAGAIARLAPAYYLQDGTVPRSRLVELMAHVEQVARKHDLSICNVFHAGDGNLHPLILFDPEDAGQAGRVIDAGREILEKCIEVGGNITGEHGVGVEKMLEMRMQFTPGEIQVMREVKAIFDPEDRCNPGKILPSAPIDEAEWAPRAAAPAAAALPADSPLPARAFFEPANADEVAALLRRRQAERAPIDVVGGGTKLRRTCDAVLSTRRMDAIVEYAPQDLYVRVQAGMTIGKLQALIARDRLWWPVPHPWPEATLGGIVASNWNGPARWRLGAIRDLVLGGVVVLPDGRKMRIGGKVVKNVAGYDLTKLHVGAQGTLGVLCELNLKLAALPPAHESISSDASHPREAVAAALRAFQQSLVASSILVFGGDRGSLPLEPQGGATVVVTATGHPADVAEETRVLRDALGTARPLEVDGETLWCGWQRSVSARPGVLLRIGVPNRALPEIVSHPALAGAAFACDATAGVAWASCPADFDVDAFADLQRMARAASGYAMVLGAPAAVLERVDRWGHQASLAPFMARLRRRWDPAAVLNPGRFPTTT